MLKAEQEQQHDAQWSNHQNMKGFSLILEQAIGNWHGTLWTQGDLGMICFILLKFPSKGSLKIDVLLPSMVCLCMTDTARGEPERSEAGTVFWSLIGVDCKH